MAKRSSKKAHVEGNDYELALMQEYASWFTDSDGMIRKQGRTRATYPDPLSHNHLEAHYGCLNMMRASGRSQQEIEQAHSDWCDMVWGPEPAKVEPMPKEFSAEDEFRARGMGIKLD
jgi:hypothetical protein